MSTVSYLIAVGNLIILGMALLLAFRIQRGSKQNEKTIFAVRDKLLGAKGSPDVVALKTEIEAREEAKKLRANHGR